MPLLQPFRAGLLPRSEWLKQRRSVRIPDFVQLLFQVELKNGTLLNYNAGILLKVEIEKSQVILLGL